MRHGHRHRIGSALLLLLLDGVGDVVSSLLLVLLEIRKTDRHKFDIHNLTVRHSDAS